MPRTDRGAKNLFEADQVGEDNAPPVVKHSGWIIALVQASADKQEGTLVLLVLDLAPMDEHWQPVL